MLFLVVERTEAETMIEKGRHYKPVVTVSSSTHSPTRDGSRPLSVGGAAASEYWFGVVDIFAGLEDGDVVFPRSFS